ncbi:uncharacterized protein LOC107980832 [Nasonia vitripennis]|uniref:Uncharacterized protein n=2 Tax=Pteromalinae TaxID=272242 RepID=A0A7M7J1C0_NASVI|nr:uncharacterized protein LOC107980832 [Nasonia vitripennis]OXU22010.1 hypothetical protein TSAR_012413 [Trichomalopsis sarcophagae]
MFSRYFLTFCLMALFVAFVSASVESEPEYEFDDSSLSIEERSKFGKKVEQILKKFFKHATEKCLKEAVAKCKKHWYNPSKVIQCAKDLWSIEMAFCLVGV